MKYNKFPNSDLQVSAICLGTWVFGGDMWSGAKEQECLDAVAAAADCGINFIDTAPIYGDGLSETVVGKAIKGKRDQFVIATKCGLIKNGKGISINLSPESIQKEVELSLKRLDIDVIDLYQCHWPDEKTPVEKTFDALRKIREGGKIKFIGVSNFEQPLLQQSAECIEISTLQSQYSLLDRGIEEEILPYCRQKGIGFLAYGPLGGGILSGKYKDPKNFGKSDARNFFYKFYNGQGFAQANKLLNNMSKISHPLSQTAINWVRQQKGVTSVLAGCRTAKHVMENAQAASWDLSEEELKLINDTELSLA